MRAVRLALAALVVVLTGWRIGDIRSSTYHRLNATSYPVDFGAASWLRAAGGGPVSFIREVFTVGAAPSRATLLVDADQSFRLFVNGAGGINDAQGARSGLPPRSQVVDLTSALVPGTNILAFEVSNHDNRVPELRARLTITAAGSSVDLVSGSASWRATADITAARPRRIRGQPNFTQASFNDAEWQPAKVVKAPRSTAPAIAPPSVIGHPFDGQVIGSSVPAKDLVAGTTVTVPWQPTDGWLRVATTGTYSLFLGSQEVFYDPQTAAPVGSKGTSVRVQVLDLGRWFHRGRNLLTVHIADQTTTAIYVDGFLTSGRRSMSFSSNPIWGAAPATATPSGSYVAPVTSAVELGPVPTVFTGGTHEAVITRGSRRAPSDYRLRQPVAVVAAAVLLWLALAVLAALVRRTPLQIALVVGGLGMLPALLATEVFRQIARIASGSPPFPYGPVSLSALAAVAVAGPVAALLLVASRRERTVSAAPGATETRDGVVAAEVASAAAVRREVVHAEVGIAEVSEPIGGFGHGLSIVDLRTPASVVPARMGNAELHANQADPKMVWLEDGNGVAAAIKDAQPVDLDGTEGASEVAGTGPGGEDRPGRGDTASTMVEGGWLRRHAGTLGVVFIAAGVLPFLAYDLGYEPIWQDEQASIVAAKAMRTHAGLPRLPSGLLYFKGKLYHALLALVSFVAGWNPVALRTISVFWYLATVLAFGLLLAPTVLPNRTRFQIVATLIFATAPQELAWARDVRMYQQAQFFAVVFIAFFWRALSRSRKVDVALACASLVGMYLSHEETFVYLPAIAVCFLVFGRWRALRMPVWWMWGGAATTIIAIQYQLTKIHPPVLGTDLSNRPYVQYDTRMFFYYIGVVYFRVGSHGGVLTLLSSFAVVATIVGIKRRDAARMFLAILVWVTVLSLSVIFTSKITRYTFVTLPPLFVLGLLGGVDVLEGCRRLVTSVSSRVDVRRSVRVVIASTAGLGMIWLTLSLTGGARDYGLAAARLTHATYTHKHVDYQVAAQYIAAHAQPGDAYVTLATPGPVSLYLGRKPDDIIPAGTPRFLYITERDGRLIDTVFGSPLILTAADLEAVMAAHRRIWLVTEPGTATAAAPTSMRPLLTQFTEVDEGYGVSVFEWTA